MLESGRNRAVGHEALLFVNPSHNMTSKGNMKDRKISLSAEEGFICEEKRYYVTIPLKEV